MPAIAQNNPALVKVTFLDATGTPFDPFSDIEIHVEAPDSQVAKYVYPGQAVRIGLGAYEVKIALSQAGTYIGRGQGVTADGFLVSSEDVQQSVLPTRVA